jgi:phosphatidylserine/phosphatidylglycerophosphate/cardiolipin synthase-like enzyme
MRTITFLIAVFALHLSSFCEEPKAPEQKATIQVYFSPKGGCTKAIIDQINQAKETIHVQAFSFTSQTIAQALRHALLDNVKIQVLLDRSHIGAKYSVANYLSEKIPVYIDSKHAIAHNKIIIIDSKIVITGSFNFTKAAEEGNAENLLIINDPDLAKKYIENWNEHLEHCEPYVRPEEIK